jgi:anaerobic selenocysteine-containing dehydrogenase
MHNAPSFAKGPDRARLWMHPDDAARHSLPDGARVEVKSRAGAVCAVLRVTAEVMPGVVSLPHGFGHAGARETLRIAGALPGANVDALTDAERIEPLLGMSVLNGVPVQVRAAD